MAFARLAHALSQRGPVGVGSVSDHGCPGQPGFPVSRHVQAGGRRAPYQTRYPGDRGVARRVRQLRRARMRSRSGRRHELREPPLRPWDRQQDSRHGLRLEERSPWAIPACVPTANQRGQYDQAVVANLLSPSDGFGAQSLRMSNACASGEFFNQTYSSRVQSPAGEERANKVFIAQFSFISKTPGVQQPGLFLSVSPDSYEGSRMSWVGLEDTPAGIQVTASDAPEVDGEFVPITTLRCRLTVRFHTRSGSGSRSTPARTTTWCESPSTVVTSVSASRRGRTTTAPLRSRHRRRTSIRRRTSTACSSAPACPGFWPRRWWLPVRQRQCHDAERPWSARVRPGDRQGGRRGHGECGRPRGLHDHRPQPRPCQRRQRPGLRSRPARDDVRGCQPQAESPRRAALPR